MNRSAFYDQIEYRISVLAYRIDTRAKSNILNFNIHAESFYVHFLNLVFGWDLRNLNQIEQNAESIDLAGDKSKIVAQVTGTGTKQKIEAGLGRDLSEYKGYTFKFVSISKDGSNLRKNTFKNDSGLKFDPKNDIIDIVSLLKVIEGLPIDRQKKICEFVDKELKIDVELEKVEQNLTKVIQILSKEDWTSSPVPIQLNSFLIPEKIEFNKLELAEVIINEHKIHYARLDEIYKEFDEQGSIGSVSILNGIQSDYLRLCLSDLKPDSCFFELVITIMERIRASSNYQPMPEEELRLCSEITVVHAFMRCKAFRNPSEAVDANS